MNFSADPCLNILEESDFEFNLGQRMMTAATKEVNIDGSLNQQNLTSNFFDFDAERENLVVPPSAYVNSENFNDFSHDGENLSGNETYFPTPTTSRQRQALTQNNSTAVYVEDNENSRKRKLFHSTPTTTKKKHAVDKTDDSAEIALAPSLQLNNARIYKNPYRVHQFDQQEFIDFASLAEQRNWALIKISDLDWIQFTQDEEVSFKYLEDDYVYSEDLKFPRKVVEPWRIVFLKPAYNEKISLEKDKSDDIEKIIRENWVPMHAQVWLSSLL